MTREDMKVTTLRMKLRDRRVALLALIAVFGASCLVVVLAMAFASTPEQTERRALAGGHDVLRARPVALDGSQLASMLKGNLEGTPTAADIRNAQDATRDARKRQLAAHPYFRLYKLAKRRFGVPWTLVASVHYQETGFDPPPPRSAASSPGSAIARPSAACRGPSATRGARPSIRRSPTTWTSSWPSERCCATAAG